jgi:hypothetical protein
MESVPAETEYKLSEYLYRQLTYLEREISLLKAKSKPYISNTNYVMKMAIADADPGLGSFRIDNLDWSLATNLFFDDVSNKNEDMLTELRMLKRNDEILLQDTTSTARIRYRITNCTIAVGYFKVLVGSVVSITGVKPVVNTLFNLRFVQY